MAVEGGSGTTGQLKNSSFQRAKAAKEDEFYTQLSDIERELKHYRAHFKGKVVYCNCDDPWVSNFFHYFAYNFEKLGLKRLITTAYKSQHWDLFSQNDAEQAISLQYEGDKQGNRVPDPKEIGINALQGDGDFRSPESIALLEQADIVVTNPPFSLFREYVAQLMGYGKKFVIVGNQNAISYKEIFPLVKQNKMWLGVNSGDMAFRVPDHYQPRPTRYWQDDEGRKWRSMGNACWFTNLDHAKRHEELILYETYSADDYPAFDNYDAIDVGKTSEIPADFMGVMGVPVTFLSKHNPNQFEIVGITRAWSGDAAKVYPKQVQVDPAGKRSTVTKLNDSGAVKVSTPPADKTYYEVNGDFFLKGYARILIKRRAPTS
jgi:hypothetical protein